LAANQAGPPSIGRPARSRGRGFLGSLARSLAGGQASVRFLGRFKLGGGSISSRGAGGRRVTVEAWQAKWASPNASPAPFGQAHRPPRAVQLQLEPDLTEAQADLPLCNLGSVASGAMPLRTDGAIRPPGQCGAELDQPGQTRGRMGIVLRPALAGRGFLVPCQWAAASLSQPSRPRPQAGVLSAPGRVGHGRSLGLKWAAGGGLAPASRRRWPSDHAAGPAAGLGGPSPRQRIADPRMASGPWKTNPPNLGRRRAH
jgi:hypothetical protein